MTTTPAPIAANIDRLYNLLPISYRQRDMEEGSPLQMLLRVIAEQVNVVEQDIAQLYNNWFIETCQDWVVPYIADLIGFQSVAPPDLDDPPSDTLESVLVPRREVANTIRYRRRKGTLSLIQDLANAVSGWPALVVEFDQHVNITQSLDHLHLARGRYSDLRDTSQMDLIGSAFDRMSHSVELRQLDSPLSQGRYNIAGVGVLIGRLHACSVTRSLAYCQEEISNQCYSFSILGNDVQLFSPTYGDNATPGDSVNAFPVPIRRIAFRHGDESGEQSRATTRYYGEDKGLAIWAPGWSNCDPTLPIPASRIIPADLTDWRYTPKQNHIAVDPQLGRIVFPTEQLPPKDVKVSYHYGCAAYIGGGEYPRSINPSTNGTIIYEVGAGLEFSTITSACERWQEQKPRCAVIEIADSAVYQEQIHLTIAARQLLELRAASGARPVLLVKDSHASRPDAITVAGEEHSQFTLDGIMIAGRGIGFSGGLNFITIRHTTLVPGWSLHHDSKPRRSGEPSIALNNLKAQVEISDAILGGIEIYQESDEVDPLELRIANSILDCHERGSVAIGAPNDLIAPTAVQFRNSTVIGRVQVHSVELAQNTLFLGEVRVARKQQGCLRFCYVPRGSRTPRRYHCQPDLVEQAAIQTGRDQGLSAEEVESLRRMEEMRVDPQFMSKYFGTSDYCRLDDGCAVEIMAGADDQSEIGVFHHLFQPQRTNNLRTRLSEYTPAGIDAGIIFVT